MALRPFHGFVFAIISLVVEVISFWFRRLRGWYRKRSLVDYWLDLLKTADNFEDWEQAALALDSLKGLNLWRNDPSSRSYDWDLIRERLNLLVSACRQNEPQIVLDLVRSGLVRNLGNITWPRLYNRAFAGTKYLIEEYVYEVSAIVDEISRWQPGWNYKGQPLTTQLKLDFLHDSRQAFGRSTLVLQGGAIFGLCHLGVVKALHLRGLLPRIITGTATGALIASLVAIHPDEELQSVLRGDGIDLTAFDTRNRLGKRSPETGWVATLIRRANRFMREGYFLDVKVLEQCVKANVGDLTFEEAYNRSQRVLNITVAMRSQGGVPTLLNYITAPNVLIWTAAVASNSSTPSLYGSKTTTILCRDAEGNVVPWASENSWFEHGKQPTVDTDHPSSPLARTAQLFNVNHFIVSQARPYLIPFLESDMHGPSLFTASHKRAQITGHIVRLVGLEIRHRLRQLDTLQLLPSSIRRFLVDEEVPGASMTLVPKVSAGDFIRLLEVPTRDTLDYWILKGERSVWPAIGALKVRCSVEFGIERAYQRLRALKANELRRKASPAVGVGSTGNANNHQSQSHTGASAHLLSANLTMPALPPPITSNITRPRSAGFNLPKERAMSNPPPLGAA